MKILVTGGAGFIGSHVVDKYINLGHEVVVVDDLSSGRKENLNPKAKFYQADIKNLAQLETIFAQEKFDIVNHHAAEVSVSRLEKEPFLAHEANVIGTTNLLLLSSKYPIKKFIFASTGGGIYGEPEKIPVEETVRPEPISVYALSKLLGEELVMFYGRRFNFPYLILRYANVYGPRQDFSGRGGVIATFIGAIKNNRVPSIAGNGTQTRDYVYIDDVAEANALGLDKVQDEVINIGTGRETSTQEVYDMVAKSLDWHELPNHKDLWSGDIIRTALDINKAKNILNWQPQINLEEGIRRTISAA